MDTSVAHIPTGNEYPQTVYSKCALLSQPRQFCLFLNFISILFFCIRNSSTVKEREREESQGKYPTKQ